MLVSGGLETKTEIGYYYLSHTGALEDESKDLF